MEHHKAKELKGTLALAIIAVLGMIATLIIILDDLELYDITFNNVKLILILFMFLPIIFLVWLLARKIHEVTELREQFYQSQKMEAIGRLAGGIAHDFNNILASSTGYAEFLAEDLKDTDPKLHDFAQQILRANNQAKKLVEQILSFSRKQQDMENSIVDLRPMLLDLNGLLKATMKPGIEFEANIPEQPLYTKANTNLLHQLIMNLCVNATDAVIQKGKGKISISVTLSKLPENLCLPQIKSHKKNKVFTNEYINKSNTHYLLKGSINPEEDYIIIDIKDTGTGIPTKTLKKIFDPFFTTKGINKGTGLGLSAAQNILEEHNAGMIVKTISDEGTCFTTLLPHLKEINNTAEDTRETKKGTDESKSNRKNILLAEDDLSVAGIIELMLERLGHTSIHCLDPLEALDVLDSGEKYDLIISDYRMPHMNGLEFARKLYKTSPETPFILITGFSDEKISKQLENTSIKSIVRKPMRSQELDKAIKTALAK